MPIMESQKSLEGKVTLVLNAVVSLQEQVTAMQADLKENYATKGDLADMKEEILTEVRAIGRAVDKDALAVIDHERRIMSLR